jgi:chromosome segregation ATPase
MATAKQAAYLESDVMRPSVAPTSPAGTRNSRGPRGTASSTRRKTSGSGGSAAGSRAKKPAATTAGDSLDHAQHALDQAAKTEKRLRANLKKHDESVSALRQDLARRSRDLEEMKSQLKAAKKSRKRAAKEFSRSTKQTTTTTK